MVIYDHLGGEEGDRVLVFTEVRDRLQGVPRFNQGLLLLTEYLIR